MRFLGSASRSTMTSSQADSCDARPNLWRGLEHLVKWKLLLCFEPVSGQQVTAAGYRIGSETSENAERFSRGSALEGRLLP